MKPFNNKYSNYFFGREGYVKGLIEKLKETNFLAVIGPSGVGKSSLIIAGLLKKLEDEAYDKNQIIETNVFQPGSEPIKQIAVQLNKLSPSKFPEQLIDVLSKQIRENPQIISGKLKRYFGGKPDNTLIVWVIDQFETIFTQSKNEEEKVKFAQILLALAQNKTKNIIIITLRADYFAAVLNQTQEAFHQLAALIEKNIVSVTPLNEHDLRKVIVEPAKKVGLVYEDKLVETILDDAKGHVGILPLLANTLRELYDRSDGNLLTLKAYKEIGGVTGSIAKYADSIYENFSPKWQEITQHIFIRLAQIVQVGQVIGQVSLRVRFKDLISSFDDKSLGEEVIRALVNARLLSVSNDNYFAEVKEDSSLTDFDKNNFETAWVEVAHESLIYNWPKLNNWVREDRAALQKHIKLLQSAKDWEDRNENQDILYRGSALLEAMSLLKERRDLFGDLERNFLEESKKREEKEERSLNRKKWLKRTAIGLAALIVVFIFLIRVFYNQRQFALSLKLAAESLAQEHIDQELSLLLAIKADEITPTKQSEIALRQALSAPYVLRTFRDHQAQVISAVQSLDGKYVVSAGADKTARIWKPDTGEIVAVLKGHTDWVYWATFSPDSKYVVTASKDKTAAIWDSQTGNRIITFEGHQSSVNNAAFNHAGDKIVSVGSDKTARVWDLSGKEILKLEGHKDWINSGVFSPDDKIIATASGDKTAKLWDARTGQLLKTLEGYQSSVLSVAFSPDSRHVITGSSDKSAIVWDVETGAKILDLRGHTLNVNDAEYSPDGEFIITASKDRTARIWKADTGQLVRELLGHHSSINTASFSVDGQFVFTASGDGTVRIWSPQIPRSRLTLSNHTDAVYSATFSPDGKQIVSASKDKTARIWNIEDGKQLLVLQHPTAVQSAVFSPDGRLVATSDEEGVGRIWSSADGKLLKELNGHTELIHSIFFSPDGRLVTTASKDKTARVWDVITGETLKIVQGNLLDVTTATYNKDMSKMLISSRDGTVKLWDAKVENQLSTWTTGTGFINSAMFSFDDKYIVAACGDQTARIWDVNTEQIVFVLKGHSGWVNYAEFSPNGKLVITASGDTTALIWEANTGIPLIQLSEHTNTVLGSSFSPNRNMISTSSSDKTVKIYSCDVCSADNDELLQMAKAHASRILTLEESARFLALE